MHSFSLLDFCSSKLLAVVAAESLPSGSATFPRITKGRAKGGVRAVTAPNSQGSLDFAVFF